MSSRGTKHVDGLAAASKELAEKRAVSLYGIEAQGKGAGELFEREDGEASLAQAREALERARALHDERSGAGTAASP